MKAELMDGTYYEIGGGMSSDIIVKIDDTELTDKTAKTEAWETERTAYKNTYKNGKRIESVCLYDPYGDSYYPVGEDRLYYEPLPEEMQFKYRMLSRLKSDCHYFLGNGNGYVGHLWAGSVDAQIKEMRDRWNEFEEDEKPEWLTMEQIDDYERRMKYAEMR